MAILTPLKNRRLWAFQGRELTLRQWAEATGIARRALDQRISYGWPIERVLTEPVRPHPGRSTQRHLTLDGETLPVSEWARRTGLERGTITRRLQYGWSEEAALTTPPKPRKRS